MHRWIRILVCWTLAVALPAQSFAMGLGHCDGSGGHPAAGQVASQPALPGAPCANHPAGQPGSSAPALDHHASHGAACAACCAVPASIYALAAPAQPVAAVFPPVIDRLAQFIPTGLKRPPSVL
jgi:hypothetical protein